MLEVLQATDLSLLAGEFLARSQTADVFAKTAVVVPNLAAADWLQQRIARQNGVAAQLDLIFWAEFERRIVEDVFGASMAPCAVLYSDTAMHWRLFAAVLREHKAAVADDAHPLHSVLAPMLEGVDGRRAEQRLWAYAGEAARIFSDYRNMRSRWLDAWSNGEVQTAAEMFADSEEYLKQPDWLQRHSQAVLTAQSYLWQRCFGTAWQYRKDLLSTLRQQAAAGRIALLPAVLHIFTAASMSAAALDLVQTLGKALHVILYHQSISSKPIADIVDPHWLRRLPHTIRSDGHYSSGHPLAARFGKSERALQRLFAQRGIIPEMIDVPEPAVDTVLAHLQHDIHELNDEATLHEGGADDSLVIHSCRGFLRQLEVLRVEIVRWLHADSERCLADILIVAPDISEHQDAIRAIFPPSGGYDGFRLPARLTGVSTPETENLWLGVGGLYTLLQSGFDAERVCSWLLLEENCAAYGAAPDAMQRITTLLLDAGFRRGYDSRHLAAADSDDRFTFLYALDRLAAGYAMPDAAIYADSAVPLAGIQTSDFAAINALCQFAEDCAAALAHLAEYRSAADWLEALQNRLDGRYAALADSSAAIVIAECLRDLRYELGRSRAFADSQTLPVLFVISAIGQTLSGRRLSSEPSGVITIGRLAALRALPYKLIAFIGAREGSFPSYDNDRRYNLIYLSKPEAGDRSRESDELGAFLQLLTSAEQTCWLFYDAGDDGETVPPMPIQEIIDYYAETDPKGQAENQIRICRHAAAPFHPDQDCSSPAPLWYNVAKALQENRGGHRPWLSETSPPENLAAAAARWRQEPLAITAAELVRTLLHPASAYLQQAGIASIEPRTAAECYEPLQLNGLARWQLTDSLLHGRSNDAILARLPLLPIGRIGSIAQQQVGGQLAARLAALKAETGQSITAAAPAHCRIGNDQLSTHLPAEPAAVWTCISPSRIQSGGKWRIKRLLPLWIDHLLWQTQGGGQTIASYDDGAAGQIVRLAPLESAAAAAELEKWLCAYVFIQHQPWFLPLEIGWAALEAGKSDHAIRGWLGDDDYSYPKKIDSGTAWQLLLQGMDEEAQSSLLALWADKYSSLLLPLYQAMTSGAEAHN